MTIYLDNMAATPVDPRVAEHHKSMMIALPGNGHSVDHAHGAAAAQVLENAAEDVAAFVGRPSEDLCFTPGASAALWLAIESVLAESPQPARIAVSATEHPALLDHLRQAAAKGRIQLITIAVDNAGIPQVQALVDAMAQGVDLVCAMAANNEVGTITDWTELAAIARLGNARLLVDASQAGGRLPMADYAQADYLIVSGAKMYGPRRVGVLVGKLGKVVRSLAETLFGSPDVAGASAMALACRLRLAEGAVDEVMIADMRDRLQGLLERSVPGLVVNGVSARRLAGSLHVSAPDIPGEAVVARLWDQVSLSTGAACQSGVPGPSHVLTAMGVPEWVAEGAVRIGVGRFNNMDEIDRAAELISTAMTPVAARRRA